MRIGLVTPSWPGGDKANGIATAVAHLATGLAETGHGVTIIPLAPAAESDAAVINLPPPRAWTLVERLSSRLGRDIASGPILIERLIQAARTAIARDGIEALVIEETHGWAGALQQALDIPVVITLHGPWFLIGPLTDPAYPQRTDRAREKREGKALATCVGFMAPSRDVLDRTIARYGLADLPSAVIRNPMPTGMVIDYDALDANERQSLLFVGRFDYLKGGDTVLTAFTELVSRGVDARLTIVGPDRGLIQPDGSRQHLAEALALLPAPVCERIDYRGVLPRAEIEKLRTRHGIAIIASRYETLGYAMVESLAAGAATVCTAIGGQTEVVRDGETGLLIPPGNPTALAAACRRLFEDRELAAQLGAAGRASIGRDFAPGIVARELVRFLEKIVGDGHRTGPVTQHEGAERDQGRVSVH